MTNNPESNLAEGTAPSSSTQNECAIGTLESFVVDKKCSPIKFLTGAFKNGTCVFETSDRDQATTLLDQGDPTRQRLLALANKTISFKSGACIPSIMSWIGAVIQLDLRKFTGKEIYLEGSVQEAFREICEGLTPALNEKSKGKHAANILMLAVLWLAQTRQLDVFDAAPSLRRALQSNSSRDRSAHQLRRSALLFLARSPVSVPAIRRLLDLVQLWVIKANAVEHDANQQAAAAERASAETTITQSRATAAEQRCLLLETRVKDLAAKIEQLEEQLRGREITSLHSRGEFRSRASAFLTSLEERFLSTALEAARMDPPRTAVILERIEIAQQAIQKEVEWLEYSD